MTQTLPDISPLMPMHQDPLLVGLVFLTHRGLMTHICSSKLNPFSAKPLSEQCWLFLGWNFRQKFQWNMFQNAITFLYANAFDRIICNHRWCTMKENSKYKPQTLLLINRYLPFKFHMNMTFTLENYCADCKGIAKVVINLTEVTLSLNCMAGCSYLLR